MIINSNNAEDKKLEKTENHTWDFAVQLQKLAVEKPALSTCADADLVEKVNAVIKDLERWKPYLKQATETTFFCALKAGYALEILRQKIAPERKWVDFVKTNLPGLSLPTVYRYLDLARRYPDPKSVPSGMGIMKALALEVASPWVKKQRPSKDSEGKPCDAVHLRKQIASIKQSMQRFSEGDSLLNVVPKERGLLAAELNDLIVVLEKVRSALKPTQEGRKTPELSTPVGLPAPLGKAPPILD